MGSQVHGTQEFNTTRRAEIKFSEDAMIAARKIVSQYPQASCPQKWRSCNIVWP